MTALRDRTVGAGGGHVTPRAAQGLTSERGLQGRYLQAEGTAGAKALRPGEEGEVGQEMGLEQGWQTSPIEHQRVESLGFLGQGTTQGATKACVSTAQLCQGRLHTAVEGT